MNALITSKTVLDVPADDFSRASLFGYCSDFAELALNNL